jgi:hypothetical protein
MAFNARTGHNRPRSSVVLLPAVSTALLALFLMATPAFAQVRGNYSPGSTLTGGGTVPGPGFSYSNQFWYGDSNELKGQNGNTLPIQNSVTVLIDNNTLLYVPKVKFLRANLEFSVDIAVSNGRLSARDPFSGGSTVSGGGAGLTNTSLVPFDLGWHFKWADVQTGYSVSIPTGHYVLGAPNNVSSGYWTNSWQTGATLYLTKSKNFQISVFNTYAWNTTQRGTSVHPGQNDSVDYSLSQIFSLDKSGKWSLQFGPGGYGQWQTTNNQGQNPVREALTYGVNAGGFIINLNAPFKGLYGEYSAMWEYAARNTYQGRTMTFTVGFNF